MTIILCKLEKKGYYLLQHIFSCSFVLSQLIFKIEDWNWFEWRSRRKSTSTVKPESCDHPKCHGNVVVNDRWSLKQVHESIYRNWCSLATIEIHFYSCHIYHYHVRYVISIQIENISTGIIGNQNLLSHVWYYFLTLLISKLCLVENKNIINSKQKNKNAKEQLFKMPTCSFYVAAAAA